MKNIFLYTLSFLVLAFTFIGCSNDMDDKVFSCDPNMDRWVKNNIKEIKQMKRADWVKLDESRQRPAYSAFSPEQKYELWINKIDELSNLNLNTLEQDHVNKLRNIILTNSAWFEDNISDEILDDIDGQIFVWEAYAKDTLKWSDRLIGAILMTANKVKNRQGEVEINANAAAYQTRAEMTCDCSKESDWCNHFISECGGYPCEIKRTDCGTLWLKDCDGICGPAILK